MPIFFLLHVAIVALAMAMLAILAAITAMIFLTIAGATILMVLAIRARARRAVTPAKPRALHPVGFGGWE